MKQDTIHDLSAPYALDALDEHERHAFEEHLESCADCRAEVTALQVATEGLAYAVEGPPPPSALRARIVDAVGAERSTVVPLRRPYAVPGLAAAAAVAAVVAIALGLWAASLSRSLDSERSARDAQARAVAVLAAPDARRVSLSAGRGSLVVAPSGEAALVLASLGRAPEGKTYEAWVVREGRPEAAGLFSGDREHSLVALSRRVPRGATVAVTLEPAGGVEQPTGRILFSARA